MTEQTFHITGLAPRSAICERRGRTWSAPQWPGDDDMRGGCFVRCKDCERLFTPALQTAIAKGRELEHIMLAACKTGWRQGSSRSTDGNEAQLAGLEELVHECRKIGRRAGSAAARLVREAKPVTSHPGSPEPDGGATTAGAAP